MLQALINHESLPEQVTVEEFCELEGLTAL